MTSATEDKLIPESEDSMQLYIRDIRSFPLLTPEEELALAKRCAAGDAEAVRQMVNSNLRLVVSVAREYAGRGVPLMDLIQEGSIGLLAAAKKFDYTMECRFSTYATKWIRQGVTRYLAENAQVIRIPSYTAERLRKVLTAQATLFEENEKLPTAEQIAAYCDMPLQKVRQLLLLNHDTWSLDAPVGEDADPLGALLVDPNAPQPHQKLVREELKHTMDQLLSSLTERQQTVLRLHFGMEDGICYSLEQISKRLDISKERVRQIESQATERLKKLGADLGLEDFLDE